MSVGPILLIVHRWGTAGGVQRWADGLMRGGRALGRPIAVLTLDPSLRATLPIGALVDRDEGGLRVLRAAYRLNDARHVRDTWDERRLDDALDTAIRWTGASVVHLAHLDGWGIAPARAARRHGCSFAATVHDWLAVCPRGQMVRGDGVRCDVADPSLCARCYGAQLDRGPIRAVVGRIAPERLRAAVATHDSALSASPPSDTLVRRVARRQRRLLAMLENADLVCAPSAFAGQLLEQHGLRRPVHVVPHGVHSSPPRPPPPGPVTFAFFGTDTPTKGLALVEAVAQRLADLPVSIEIHGPPARPDRGILRWCGPYTADEAPERFARSHAVLVPSQWAENRPVVVVEAFAAGRPVLASRLGGLPEDIEDPSFLLPPEDPAAWERLIRALHADPARLRAAALRLRRPLTRDESAAHWFALHDGLSR